MKVQYGEEVVNHSDPESCGTLREERVEALTGATGRPAIEPRNNPSGAPTLSFEAEGNTGCVVNHKTHTGSARSETLCMSGSLSYGSSEISSASTANGRVDGAGKGLTRNPVIHAGEKSDIPIRPEKWPNNGDKPEEATEERGVASGNSEEATAARAQNRDKPASKGLQGVREAARRDRERRFTSLLHHITPELLSDSYYKLSRKAATGVDGVSWRDYEPEVQAGRLTELHAEVHSGRYRAQPSRRVYIPKADGRLRPLGIAALEDKIVQQAVVTVLNEIYEADFLGFSYGFRPGRSQHNALDALSYGIEARKVNWILDADVVAFFDEIDHDWMIKFLEHRIADKRIIRLIKKWLKAGTIEEGRRVAATKGTPQGAVISPLLANVYLHYAYDLWAHQWRKRHATGDVIVVRYADDSVAGFQHEQEAKAFLAALHERLDKFGLKLHPEKTRLIQFGRFAATERRRKGRPKPETFDFLGFTHICGVRRGTTIFKLVRLTIKKRMRVALRAIRETLMRRRHESIHQLGLWLRSVVQGYLNYHSVPGNFLRVGTFVTEVRRAWLYALRRRSQRNKMTWSRYAGIAKRYIPKARVVHPYPSERFSVRTAGRSHVQ
jgi:RNA-directed DNA polymerase